MCSVRCGPGDPVAASHHHYAPRANTGEGSILVIRISTSSTLQAKNSRAE
jgi:hypothetical protein